MKLARILMTNFKKHLKMPIRAETATSILERRGGCQTAGVSPQESYLQIIPIILKII